jgi:hypothetical protein
MAVQARLRVEVELTSTYRYMQGFKCNVTNASPAAAPLAKAQVPVFCGNESDKCLKGAKQMLAWHQATGNNIETAQWVTPNYNQKCGWTEGAQTDIFEKVVTPDVPAPASSSTSSSIVAVVSSTLKVAAGSALPTIVKGDVKSSSTLVTLVSSTSGQVVTPTPTSTAVANASVKASCTASAAVAPSKTASAVVPTRSCSQRRPWRRC